MWYVCTQLWNMEGNAKIKTTVQNYCKYDRSTCELNISTKLLYNSNTVFLKQYSHTLMLTRRQNFPSLKRKWHKVYFWSGQLNRVYTVPGDEIYIQYSKYGMYNSLQQILFQKPSTIFKVMFVALNGLYTVSTNISWLSPLHHLPKINNIENSCVQQIHVYFSRIYYL